MYPVNEFSASFLANLQRSVCWYLTIDSIHGNGSPDFDGTMWERIVCESCGIPWSRSMGKYDISDGIIAWSCKTKLKSSSDPKVIGYKLSQFGKRTIPDDDILQLAEHTLGMHNQNVAEVLLTHREFRNIICVRDRKRKKYIIYEKPMPTFNSQDYEWSLVRTRRKKSFDLVEGIRIDTGKKELAISLIDNRLYHWDDIPDEKLVLVANINPVDPAAILEASGSSIEFVQCSLVGAEHFVPTATLHDLIED